jgi:hypothetical protein
MRAIISIEFHCVGESEVRQLIGELTAHEEARSKKACDVALNIIRNRGRSIRTDSGQIRIEVTGHGFTVKYFTPFNPSLLKTASEERESWRGFRYRLMISRSGRSCLDVYWNIEGQIFTRAIRVESWDEKFLKYFAT